MSRAAAVRAHTIVLIVVGAIGIGGCGSQDDSSGGEEDKSALELGPPADLAPVDDFETCDEQDLPGGGGYDVRARGLTCERVGELLPRVGFAAEMRGDHQEDIYESDGWTCWSRSLEENGPIQNVCWSEDAALVFKFG